MRDCEHCKHHKNGGCESWDCEFEPTTKNDCAEQNGCITCSLDDGDDCCRKLFEESMQEPATKNDLAVDCISRQAVLDLIADYDLSMGQVVRGIHALPPVTPQEPRWIPVSERLPDTDDEVLCWYEYYHWSQEKVLPEYGIGSYFKETESWFGEVAIGHKVRVIAWMPLPKPNIEVEE